MHVTMIAAMARNRVIGTGKGQIPWSLPRDQRHFRSFTKGKHLLLGRITYEEMLGWFTDQTPIILTKQEGYAPEFGRVAHSVEESLTLAAEAGANELCVCGGAHVFQAALPFTDELHLTLIDTEAEGTVLFPDYEEAITWEVLSEEVFEADNENSHSMTFLHLRRVRPSSLRPSRMHWG